MRPMLLPLISLLLHAYVGWRLVPGSTRRAGAVALALRPARLGADAAVGLGARARRARPRRGGAGLDRPRLHGPVLVAVRPHRGARRRPALLAHRGGGALAGRSCRRRRWSRRRRVRWRSRLSLATAVGLRQCAPRRCASSASTCRSPACPPRSTASRSPSSATSTSGRPSSGRTSRRSSPPSTRSTPTWSRSPATWSTARCAELARARRAARRPALARRHLLRHRQPRVLLGRRRLGRASCAGSACTVLINEHVVDPARRRADWCVAGVTDYQRRPFRSAPARSDPRRALAGSPAGGGAAAARAPAAQRRRGRGGRLRPAALRPHPRRPVPALEFPGPPAAALHRRAAPLAPDVGLHQPRHRLLGAAEALRRAFGDHPAAARRGAGAGRAEAGPRRSARRHAAGRV